MESYALSKKCLRGEPKDMVLESKGVLWIKGRICISRVGELSR